MSEESIMNNSMHSTAGTTPVAQYIPSQVSENVALTPSCLNCFLAKITDIITSSFSKKNKDDDYKKFTMDFTFTLLHEIQKTHIRNNSYHIPQRIELEHLNNTIIFENNDKNIKEKPMTKITVANQQDETSCKTISTETFLQFCRINLAIERNILTEAEISFTPEGEPDSSKMDAATESLLSYILSDADALESTLQDDTPKHLQTTSSEQSILTSESSHPAHPTALKRNASFLYRHLSRKTVQNNSAINKGNPSLKKPVNTPEQKSLEDIICKIVNKLKNSYSKDSTQKRSAECDGLFRTQGNKNENETALVNLEKRSLVIDETHRDTLVYVINKRFDKINPIKGEVLSQMIKNPNKAAKILHERINTKEFENKKALFLTILEFYSDAYQSADDSTTSMFNKTQLLTASLRPTILPELYDCIDKSSMALSLIKEMSNVGDRIVLNILTSFSYENGSAQLKANYQD